MTLPSQILTNYSHVLIDFALGSGEGIRPGDIVYLTYDEPAKPLALKVYTRILEKGGMPILKMASEDFQKILYLKASDLQLSFFPENYMKSLVDTIDHRIYLMADKNPLFLQSIDPAKIMKSQSANQKLKKWLFEKEDAGGLTWTLCLYGTPGLARQAGLSIQDYWDQIIRACYLDREDPVGEWKRTYKEMADVKKRLNILCPDIDKLHVEALDTDLWIRLGDKRKFIDGGGANIPSFELFTSPDWRGTEGKIFFDLPLYRYGTIIRDIHLEFKNGMIVSSKAGVNQQVLQELLSQKNANKVGEFSITDKRFSRINKFMATTLFDENFGGEFGNTHLAVGSSYHDTYTGDIKAMKDKDWEKLGFNDSPEHTDIIATHDRTVTAHLKNGVELVIYRGGEYRV
ncbi:MAG: aminopeptidase [Candidatus Roizmanbacteria bacterium]